MDASSKPNRAAQKRLAGGTANAPREPSERACRTTSRPVSSAAKALLPQDQPSEPTTVGPLPSQSRQKQPKVRATKAAPHQKQAKHPPVSKPPPTRRSKRPSTLPAAKPQLVQKRATRPSDQADAPATEKRLAKYRPAPTVAIHERNHRVQHQQLFLVHRSDPVDHMTACDFLWCSGRPAMSIQCGLTKHQPAHVPTAQKEIFVNTFSLSCVKSSGSTRDPTWYIKRHISSANLKKSLHSWLPDGSAGLSWQTKR